LPQDFTALGWRATIDSLGAPPGSQWLFQRFVHMKPSDNCAIKDQDYVAWSKDANFPSPQRTRFATGAYMDLAINRPCGIILAQSYYSHMAGAIKNWTPRDLAQSPIQYVELSQLWRLSDFLWGFRKKSTSLARAWNIRYYGVYNAHDRITLALVARFLGERGLVDLEPWPADNSEFLMSTRQGRALLALRSYKLSSIHRAGY
jgi:hypothetical protein